MLRPRDAGAAAPLGEQLRDRPRVVLPRVRRVAVPASRVEPELRELRDEAGRPVELLYSSRILY